MVAYGDAASVDVRGCRALDFGSVLLRCRPVDIVASGDMKYFGGFVAHMPATDGAVQEAGRERDLRWRTGEGKECGAKREIYRSLASSLKGARRSIECLQMVQTDRKHNSELHPKVT